MTVENQRTLDEHIRAYMVWYLTTECGFELDEAVRIQRLAERYQSGVLTEWPS